MKELNHFRTELLCIYKWKWYIQTRLDGCESRFFIISVLWKHRFSPQHTRASLIIRYFCNHPWKSGSVTFLMFEAWLFSRLLSESSGLQLINLLLLDVKIWPFALVSERLRLKNRFHIRRHSLIFSILFYLLLIFVVKSDTFTSWAYDTRSDEASLTSKFDFLPDMLG